MFDELAGRQRSPQIARQQRRQRDAAREVAETSTEAWNETLRVNLSGVFHCTRAALPVACRAAVCADRQHREHGGPDRLSECRRLLRGQAWRHRLDARARAGSRANRHHRQCRVSRATRKRRSSTRLSEASSRPRVRSPADARRDAAAAQSPTPARFTGRRSGHGSMAVPARIPVDQRTGDLAVRRRGDDRMNTIFEVPQAFGAEARLSTAITRRCDCGCAC